MKIYDVDQGSEAWQKLRMRPTASRFKSIVTAVKLEPSSGMLAYACEIVSKELGTWDEPMTSAAMDNGTDREDGAVAAYEDEEGVKVRRVGFVTGPGDISIWGCSPDGLVGEDGGLEVKCPDAHTLLKYLQTPDKLPSEYKLQVQGSLFITELAFWDFFVWHPGVKETFKLRVYPDLVCHQALMVAMHEFLGILDRVRAASSKNPNWTPPVKEQEIDWSE